MRITRREKKFWEQHLSCVRHITLDPKGPGVVRLHMIPPRAEGKDEPFLLLLNGAKLIPLNLSWAILLANFMAALEHFFTEGDNAPDREVKQADWERLAEEAVTATRSVYPRTKPEQLREDLALLMESLIAIARGQEPPVEVGTLSLGDYAPYMSAPHRMDLMVSAMTQDGAWHCNQKCLHCYAAGQPMGESRELTTAQWKEALERLRHANIPQVTFTGGEPTLRADLVELVEAAQWFVTRLNTNGRLLTPELCRRLYEASLDSVQVTLYSADAAVHNTLVGAPGFDDTVQGVRNAVAAGLMTSVNTPLCSLNRDYAATLRFVHELGVRYVTCSGLIPSGGAETEASQATRLTPEELTAVLRQAVETAEELDMEIDFTSPGWLPEETLRGLGLHLIPSCGACLSNMAVTPDGQVVPCQSWLGGTTLGNLLTDDWSAIWDGETCRAIRAKSAKLEQSASWARETERGADHEKDHLPGAAVSAAGGLPAALDGPHRPRRQDLRRDRQLSGGRHSQHRGRQPRHSGDAGLEASGGSACHQLPAGRGQDRHPKRLHPGDDGPHRQHPEHRSRQQPRLHRLYPVLRCQRDLPLRFPLGAGVYVYPQRQRSRIL